MRAIAFAALAVAPSVANAQNAGPACSARDDCPEGLRCVQNVCVDVATYEKHRARIEGEQKADTFGYVGATVGLSLPAFWVNMGEAFQLGFRLGAIIERSVLFQLDVVPMTSVFTGIMSTAFTSFDATASFGFVIPLNGFTSWVARFGGGGGAFVSGSAIPFGEIRLDFFNVAIRTSKHLLVEIDVPSFRILVLTSTPSNVALMWLTTLALNYTF